MGGIVVQVNRDASKSILNDLIIHNGLWFVKQTQQKPVKERNERFRLTEAVIHFLISNFQRIELSLSPQLTDIRPFLWHNYHLPKEKKFEVNPRYTSYLDISELKDLDEKQGSKLFQDLDTVRKRNIREAVRKKAVLDECDNFSLLLDNYQKTLNLGGEEFLKVRVQMELLMQAIQKDGYGQLYRVSNSIKKTIYQVFFAWDTKRAYYLFGAGETVEKENYQGTYAFWEAMGILANKGITEIDFEGVNSPNRGWFKLSFGGTLVPYFELSLNQ